VNCYDCEEEFKPRPEKKDKCKPDYHTETILKCGTATGSAPLTLNSIGCNSYGFHPIVQATVVLDTSHLLHPTVKIDFSSLISFKTCDDDNYFLRLAFKLSKVCSGGPIPLGTWTFERVSNECNGAAQVNGSGGCDFVQGTDAFGFNWCECEDCPDCCRYIVEIVDQQCYNIDYVAVSNIFLNALAVGVKKSYHD
jgi:hypothetical protein